MRKEDYRKLSPDAKTLLQILDERGERWTRYSTLVKDSRASHRTGRSWHRRYVSTLVSEIATKAGAAVLSTTRGFRLQNHTSRRDILQCHRELREKAHNTAKHANAVIVYFNRHIDGKRTLPDPDQDPSRRRQDPQSDFLDPNSPDPTTEPKPSTCATGGTTHSDNATEQNRTTQGHGQPDDSGWLLPPGPTHLVQ